MSHSCYSAGRKRTPRKKASSRGGEETLAALISTPPETIFADEPLDEAIRWLGVHDQKMLPVVARGNARHPIGVLGRDDIFQAYSVARLSEQES